MNRPNKYGAERTEVDGHKFASKKEAARYCELKLLERAGQITDLKLQVPFALVVNDIAICKYYCDFRYIDMRSGGVIVEDVKGGIITREARLKLRLMLAIHGIEVKIVR